MAARVLVATWQEDGLAGCARKVRAAAGMSLPRLVRGRRTARSVGAYFDLITDDGRLFYGDSFHFGYFPNGQKTLAEGLDAHTDLVAGLARVGSAKAVLDVGCGLAAPALRMASPPRLSRHRRQHQPRAGATGHRAHRRAGPLRPRHPPPGRRARARLPRRLLRRGRVPRGGGRHLRDRGRQGAARRRALPRPPAGRTRRVLRSRLPERRLGGRGSRAPRRPLPLRRRARHRLARALHSPGVPDRRVTGHPGRDARRPGSTSPRSTGGGTARCCTGTVAGSPPGRAAISSRFAASSPRTGRTPRSPPASRRNMASA